MSPKRVQVRLPRSITLRTRLTFLYGGLFLVAGVVLLGTTYALFSQQLSHSTPELSVSGSPGDAASPESGVESQPPRNQIVTNDGVVLTGDRATEWLERQEDELRDSATTSLITQGGVALVVVGVVAAGFGWLIAGRVLAPLHRVTDTARRIAAAPVADRGLHERIKLTGPDDEVKELADTFDTMVARLDRSFDGQRRFVANASHELRTPLTLSRGLVEVAMHRKSASDDVKQLGEGLLEINERHERLIAGLLLLARSENEITDRTPIDLADVVDHVITQTADEATRAGVVVRADSHEAVVAGDALLLERLVHNLVENGIRHNTGTGGWVHITTRERTDRAGVEVEISNTGPAVSAYELPGCFEPFRRQDSDRLVTTKGAGLGLSIVRAIARAHGGEATARPRVGGGLTATVSLPSGE